MYQTAQEIAADAMAQWNRGRLNYWRTQRGTVVDYLVNMAMVHEAGLDNYMNNYRSEDEYKAKAYREAAEIVRQTM